MHHGKSGKLLNKKFWKGKNVLVTGHTGFKGTWVSQLLVELGANVSGLSLANAPSKPCLFNLLEFDNNLVDFRGDITNLKTCVKAIKNSNPDILIHMAAQPLVRLSYQQPILTYNTNIMGTVNILESVRNFDSIKAILIVTSDKCYKNTESGKFFDETSTLGGDDPYSSSKACVEHISMAYYKSYFSLKNIGLATARAGNVIGGGDWSKDRLIPDIIKAWTKNESVIIRSPNAIRPWQHVLEPICGYLKLIELLYNESKKFSGAWNFGPDQNKIKSVLETVKMLQKLWSGKSKTKTQIDNLLYEANILKLDNTKMKKQLGIKPKMSFEDALNNTIQWYEAYYDKRDIKYVTYRQTIDYISS
ncbi:MAG: CDP-glucose 4,6-dehydratase [Candidatus Marinimicrobia bacterium]|nr:CDP-glucose 4,6-dehydratase [Candidatus Neomarinimicrobiota bacterium]